MKRSHLQPGTTIKVKSDGNSMMDDKQKNDFLNIPQLSLFSRGTKQQAIPVDKLSGIDLSNKDTLILAVSKTNEWGQLALLSLTSSIGILVVALAYEAGRLAMQWSDPLFWLGIVVIFLPIASRLLFSQPMRRERIALLVILGMGLYLVKVLQYPLYFAYHDEFSHLRTAQDIAISGHLFNENPLLPISAFYPGLEIVTNAVSSLTGLSFFNTGIVIIGVARLVSILALYLFFEHLSKSAKIAGIGTLLYMANPQFLFFQAAFSYESLAVPLAIFVLFTLALCNAGPTRNHKGLLLVTWLGIGAVVVTHHITSYVLMGLLFLWTIIDFLQKRRQTNLLGLGITALFSLVLSLFWLMYTGDIALGYLAPHFTSIVYQIQQILAGESPVRQLFAQGTGFVMPLWERIATIVSLAFIMLLLPFGLFQLWLHYRNRAAALALGSSVLLYPIAQALRFTNAGAESGVRTTEFLFLGLAFVLTIGATEYWLPLGLNRRRSLLVMGVLTVILIGQICSSETPTWARTPGPYLVVADQRSIEPEGITAAEWAYSYLGPNHRVGSDRINTLLMATYGYQWAYTSADDKTPSIERVSISPQFGPTEKALLLRDGVKYLVVDLRLSTGLPWVGYDFNEPASHTVWYTLPISLAALTKYDGVQNVNRLFDSGNIVIYDVGDLTGAP